MLTVAEDIFEEIETEAILLNGEVVRRAFGDVERFMAEEQLVKIMTEHTCCGYFPGRWRFRELLIKYKFAKTIARSAWRRLNSPLVPDSRENWENCREIRQNQFAYATECDQRSDKLRAQLHDIWPCDKCMKRDNPTERNYRG